MAGKAKSPTAKRVEPMKTGVITFDREVYSGINLRNKPDMRSKSLAVLEFGDMVCEKGSVVRGFVPVVTQKGHDGFVKSEFIVFSEE